MLIGVLSDSHGRADTTARAVQALLSGGAQMLIHLGDLGAETVIDELVGHNARIVFGNCDWDEQALAHHAELAASVSTTHWAWSKLTANGSPSRTATSPG